MEDQPQAHPAASSKLKCEWLSDEESVLILLEWKEPGGSLPAYLQAILHFVMAWITFEEAW